MGHDPHWFYRLPKPERVSLFALIYHRPAALGRHVAQCLGALNIVPDVRAQSVGDINAMVDEFAADLAARRGTSGD